MYLFLSIYQRSHFESKSQQPANLYLSTICFYQYIKDHILKANHNNEIVGTNGVGVFINISKITF
jgi:hypothetical protein